MPVTYATNTAGSDAGSLMTREIVVSVSGLILETENAVYGAQDLVADKLPDKDPYDAGNRLVYRYATAILDRARLFELEKLGAAHPKGRDVSAPAAISGVTIYFHPGAVRYYRECGAM